MTRRRFAYVSPRSVLAVCIVGAMCTAAPGCTLYSELEGLARPEGGSPPADGPTSKPDAAADGSSDRIVNDAGTIFDARAGDAASDAGYDRIAPPVDGTTRDAGPDVPVGIDATIDAAMPPDSSLDASIDATRDTSVDVAVPPRPDSGPDLTVRDVTDAGGRVDADAIAPPPDADGGPGTVDVRDAGPTCWGGTPSTHDEDRDGIVDECDNCPSISNANQADIREVNAGGSADGVGDACDPRPTAGGDSIFLFDGLNFTTLPPEWSNVGAGSWTASGTSVTTTGTETGQELARRFPSSLSNYLAETAFTFTAFELNGSSNLPFRMDAADNGWRCVVGTPDGIQGQFFLGKVTGGVSEAPPPQITPITVPRVGNRYRVLGGGFDGTIYCMLGSGERQTRSDNATSGESGFRSSGTSAVFEYLLVYRLGGTL
jgi:hypothetical protein